jgi:hypothetical protein
MQAAARFLSRWSPTLSDRVLLIGQQAYESGDYVKAFHEFVPLAQRGNADAQRNLGNMYHEGLGVPQDYNEAIKWYRLAADQGHPSAQSNLANMYHEGEGLPRDDKEAVRWYCLAANQGHAPAQFNLGLMYEHGTEALAQNDTEAMRWFGLAAEQGYADAQFNLGVMYGKGQGVPPDYVQAHMWFDLVSANGDADGNKNRDIIAGMMTPDQIAEAQRLAQEWKPKTGAESMLAVYNTQVAEFFQTLNEGPENIMPIEFSRLLDRVDDLIDVGVMLGEPAEDLVKTLRSLHQVMTSELEKAVPETRENQATINSLREVLRALRKSPTRPN